MTKVLWVDDEIQLLKPHILFLESKNYRVETVNNGTDALELIATEQFDIVFLDEHMPGLSGLEVLQQIKLLKPDLPIIMITKSEEESIMNKAIGKQIADYLIKPVNPNQILLSLKKNLHKKEIVSEQSLFDFQSEFQRIQQELFSCKHFDDFTLVYKKLTSWSLQLQENGNNEISELLNLQFTTANSEFCKFINQHYPSWFSRNAPDNIPLLSHRVIREKVVPSLRKKEQTALLVIDNCRYDQWRILAPIIQSFYKIEQEEIACSILPSTTQYARNALFAGLMPSDIQKHYPQYWLNDDDEGGKNQFEEELLKSHLERLRIDTSFNFIKILGSDFGKKVHQQFSQFVNKSFVAIVYNFVDIISHARTDTEIIRNLAKDIAAYRSLTLTWFQHSDLLQIIKKLSEKGYKLIITSDHGTIQVNKPIKVIADKNTSLNLRYKTGRSLSYNAKEVVEIHNPETILLPKANISAKYIFACHNDFLCYPNNYNTYVQYYKDTFQHGGISMEEMMVPVVTLSPV